MLKYVPRSTLETMYKSYVRSQLEYGDVIYHHLPLATDHLSIYNLYEIMTKVESVQYHADLVTTGASRGTNKEKLYKELGWEFLSQRKWLRRMTIFNKIVNNQTPAYLKDLNYHIDEPIRTFNSRTSKYKASFYPSCVDSWNNGSIITPVI